jgi:uncharacterized protein YcnI
MQILLQLLPVAMLLALLRRPERRALPSDHVRRPMIRRTLVLAASAALLAPAVAQAHISIHPNAVPAGAFATLTFRVPNESDSASTTKLAIQMPPGFTDVSAAPPPGWSFSVKTRKLATPITTDAGTVTTEVSELDFSGGKVPPGQFGQFPISVVIPGRAGDVLAFKTVQTYSNGQVDSWIGSPTSAQPAATIDVTPRGGVLQDVAGGEAGPPATLPAADTRQRATGVSATVVEKTTGASKGLGIAALIAGIVGIVLGAVALAATRRRRPAEKSPAT